MPTPETTPVYDETVAATLIDPEQVAIDWAELIKRADASEDDEEEAA
jgi:hypothetical protein